jgi:DNA polymerase-1
MKVLIDISGYIYRAFYAFPELMTTSGQHVGAVFGFSSLMLKLIGFFLDLQRRDSLQWAEIAKIQGLQLGVSTAPKFVAAADSKAPNFRHDIFAEYKVNRVKMPEQLIKQIPIIKDICCKLGFFVIERPGFEADDIIASYVRQTNLKTEPIIVVSSDKDLLQLMQFENVTIFDPMKQKFITENDVLAKFGVKPDKLLDVLALMGDSSDNIPGAPGIGPKTATDLINQFGSIQSLIKNIDSLPKSKRNMILKESIGKIELSYRLAQLCYTVPLAPFQEESSFNLAELIATFEELEFTSLIRRATELMASNDAS